MLPMPPRQRFHWRGSFSIPQGEKNALIFGLAVYMLYMWLYASETVSICFGRIVASEIVAPNLLANPAQSG